MNPEDYETLPTDNIGTHMTAGAIAGVMEHCIMYPLDSVKTRMQSLASSGTDGIGDTFLRMVRQEGIFRPIRGMSAMVFGAGPSHALYFSCYEYLKSTLTQFVATERYHPLIHGASGCCATILHDGFMNPAEVVKQRMQMLHSPYKSALGCAVSIYKTEGVRAFYRSYTTQLTMNIPFQSIHFMIYEFTQKISNPERKYNPPAHMVSGAIAGAVAAAVTTPLDVCKTLLNTQQTPIEKGGLVHAIKTVYQMRGMAGYFRGMQARIMYQMPSTAICWSTYEFFKYLLGTTQELRIVTPTSTVLAEENESNTTIQNNNNNSNNMETPSYGEKSNHRSRELPAMSGAGLYGSISFNTMHTADYRQKDSILDVAHT